MLLPEAIQGYIDHCLSRSKERKPKLYRPERDREFLVRGSTARDIRSDLVNFMKFKYRDVRLVEKRVDRIQPIHIRKFLAKQKMRTSAYRRLYSLRKFFMYCQHRGWVKNGPSLGRSLLPSKDVLPFKTRVRADRPTEAQINQVLSLVNDPLAIDPSAFVAFTLLLSGLKSKEVLTISLDNLPFEYRGSKVIIRLSEKRSKQQGRGENAPAKRFLELSPRINAADFKKNIQLLVKLRQQEGMGKGATDKSIKLLPYNRNSLSALFATLCRQASIPKEKKIHPRDLRLLAMMDQRKNGASYEKIADAFGVTKDYVERELAFAA